MRPWIVYSLLRFGIFAVMMAVLATYLRLPLESNGIVGFPLYLIAAVGASIFSLVVSYIFFPKLRAAVAADFAERRARTLRGEVDDDTAEEDALLEAETESAQADAEAEQSHPTEASAGDDASSGPAGDDAPNSPRA